MNVQLWSFRAVFATITLGLVLVVAIYYGVINP